MRRSSSWLKLANKTADILTVNNKPVKTPIPPSVGTMPLWEVRSLVWAVRFFFLLIKITLGMTIRVVTKENNKVISAESILKSARNAVISA